MQKDDQGAIGPAGDGVALPSPDRASPLADNFRLKGISLSPGFDVAAVAQLLEAPVATLPLHALILPMMALFTDSLYERSEYDVVIASAQLARGFELLGFEAELLPARARWKGNDNLIGEIGAFDRALTEDNGNLRGHVVVWVDALERCIDLGVCQHSRMRFVSDKGDAPSMPMIMKIPGGKKQFHPGGFQVQCYRDNLAFHWQFIPELRSSFDRYLANHGDTVEHGGLALAHVGLDMLAALAVSRDLSSLHNLYPRLAGLLAGRISMPLLPTGPMGQDH